MSQASALAAHNRARQSSIARLTPARVRYNGTEYDCAAFLGDMGWFTPAEGGGKLRVQTLWVDISKSLLPARPEQSKSLFYLRGSDPVEFRVEHVAGDNDTDTAWHIEARRYPKS